MPESQIISCAVEGPVDEAVLSRIAYLTDSSIGTVYGRRGKHYLDQKISGYNQAASHAPWIVLRDMDNDSDCPYDLRRQLLPDLSSNMCFRIAVRSVESWLMADRESIAAFLGISASNVPVDPDTLPSPKEFLVNLARRSRRSRIYEDMVPKPGSGRSVGAAYPSRMIEYVEEKWRPEIAITASESLRRCVECWDALE